MNKHGFQVRLRWLFVLGFLLASGLLAAEPETTPRQFSAAIGGFLGPSYAVELTAPDTVTYTSRPRAQNGPPKAEETRVRVTTAQWKTFRARLDAAKVWMWKSDYINPQVLDGTAWKLVAEFGDRKIETSGRNDYPAKAQFDAMLAAVEELLGGRSFK